MKTFAFTAAALFFLYTTAFAAETWTGAGVITDTMCAASHQSNIEHARENSGHTMTNQECTVGCVMRRGQKYVFVSGGKTYRIADQDHADLATFAAQPVTLTGTLAGDVITVSRVAAARKQ
jgi:hypothetical protein